MAERGVAPFADLYDVEASALKRDLVCGPGAGFALSAQVLIDAHPFDRACGVADDEHDWECLVGPVVGVSRLGDLEDALVVAFAVAR